MGNPEPRCGVGTASTWPLVSALEFGPLPTAVGCARAHARQVLYEWRLSHLIEDTALLVSELMTNALQATWTLEVPEPIALRLLANNHSLIIEAWDRCAQDLDLRAQPPGDREHGRGLMVVAALSKQWGVIRAGPALKVVWCELVVGN